MFMHSEEVLFANLTTWILNSRIERNVKEVESIELNIEAAAPRILCTTSSEHAQKIGNFSRENCSIDFIRDSESSGASNVGNPSINETGESNIKKSQRASRIPQRARVAKGTSQKLLSVFRNYHCNRQAEQMTA